MEGKRLRGGDVSPPRSPSRPVLTRAPPRAHVPPQRGVARARGQRPVPISLTSSKGVAAP
eukprot:gene51310-39028_t